VREALGVVKCLHDEGDRGDISNVCEIGVVGIESTTVDDAGDAVEGVGDARPRVPFGRELARMLVGSDDRPLPRLLVLVGKILTGIRRNIIRPAYCHTSLPAVLKNHQA